MEREEVSQRKIVVDWALGFSIVPWAVVFKFRTARREHMRLP